MKYKKIAVGGTFDCLHDGHKSILSKAFELGNQVLIGVTKTKIRNEKKSAAIQSLKTRVEELKSFLQARDLLDRAELVFISDPIGPADKDEELMGIVVTGKTRSKAEKINELRVENGLNKLDIIEIPLVLADDEKPISSKRIRKGKIDIHGNLMSEKKEK
ncbi:hypothetical protein AKJ57_00645 [candidate division MSBL1 archaeon SCGC-AAA259A05]|uniref:Cytidyltransferase-like domain-containing protein n=1 Tax=candidate division MSBL1 archaeon SCGC-AAA259A05 TaxID=1698259 RepID=A0A133UBQ3_9EURY|nr:hypothetical protein AKJ57_00645 [candidate division MSBL1 archaeon SCGC-AAA259A05]